MNETCGKTDGGKTDGGKTNGGKTNGGTPRRGGFQDTESGAIVCLVGANFQQLRDELDGRGEPAAPGPHKWSTPDLMIVENFLASVRASIVGALADAQAAGAAAGAAEAVAVNTNALKTVDKFLIDVMNPLREEVARKVMFPQGTVSAATLTSLIEKLLRGA